MKTTKDLTTTIQFGRGGIGKVSLSSMGNKIDGGTFTIQELISEVKIGDVPTPDQIQTLPKVVLEFHQTESIDSMIKCLEKLKEAMGQYPENTLAYAC